MKNKFVIILFALIILCLPVLANNRAVEIINPEINDINIYREVNGSIEPYKQIQLASSVGGIIEERKVKAGQYVKKGDVLLVFEQDDILANVEQAKAGLEIARANLDLIKQGAQEEQIRSAEASVRQAKAAVRIAQANYQLVKKGVSEEDLESIQATYDQAFASYEGAKESLTLMESSFEDRTMLRQQLLNAETQFASAEKQLATAKEGLNQALNGQKQAEIALNHARNEYQRIESLYHENVTTKNKFEMVEMQYKNAKSAFKNAQSAVNSAEIATKQAKLALQGAEDNYLLTKKTFNNPTEMKQQLAAARTQVEVSKANKRMAQANLDKAYKGAREEERETALANIQQAEASLEMAKAQRDQVLKGAQDEEIRIAKANLRQAEAVLQQAEKVLADTTVKSPVNGIIASANFDKGEMLGPGNPLFTIVNLDKVYIRADISPSLIRNITYGQEIRASLVDYPGKYIEGIVDFISPTINPQTQGFTVRVLAENPEGIVRGGMFVDIYINTDTRKNTLIVPIDAVLDLENNPHVYIIKNNIAERVFVETGVLNYKEVEILEGLSPEDAVVIRGQRFLSDGDMVEVIR
ncbi:efflux RND transporter periplasmic adaptor subunit [Natronospora cellulosivora (SeqCode)]